MSPDLLGLVALGSLFIIIFVGFPIDFTLLFLGLVAGYIVGIGPVVFHLMTLQVYAIVNEQVLAAVPFFLFMGYIVLLPDATTTESSQTAVTGDQHRRTPGQSGRGMLPFVA